MHSNRLQLNSNKTEFLWCTTSRRQHCLPAAGPIIGSTSIQPSSSARYLATWASLSIRTCRWRLTSIELSRAALAPYDRSAVSGDKNRPLSSSRWSLRSFSAGSTTVTECWLGYLTTWSGDFSLSKTQQARLTFGIRCSKPEHVSGAWAADFPLTAQAYTFVTPALRSAPAHRIFRPLRSRSAPITCSKILFFCIHRRPKHNSRKKTEQHNVTKLKKNNNLNY